MKSTFKITVAAALILLTAVNAEAAAPFKGFKEGAYSYRDGDNLTERPEMSLAEIRVQLKNRYYPQLLDAYSGEVSFKIDLYYDAVRAKGKSRAIADLRELNVLLVPHDTVDLKIGRQILTWGTGDFLFINDLFPKDYVSFFNGRDDEYLKRPSDAIKVSHFGALLNTDVVFTPIFAPNNSLTGERFSIFNPFTGSLEGESLDREYTVPDRRLSNSELSIRTYKNINGLEAALYFNKGFYKEARELVDPVKEEFTYPRLLTGGFSLRGAKLGGIVNMEGGYYLSRDDKNGDNPLVENSAMKMMAGYERDFKGDLKLGLQLMADKMLDYDKYQLAVAKEFARKEVRTVTTVRLSKMFMNQTVNAGLFVFYSPSDKDSYMRPSIGYDINDNLKVTFGANLFFGTNDNMYSDFGMLDGNDNYYGRLRYSF